MNKKQVNFSIIFLFLLAGCGTLPALLAPEPSPVVMTVDPSTPTPLPSQTPARIIPTATQPPTVTATSIPVATRRSPFPVQLSTPVVDLGFLPIGMVSAPNLQELFKLETRQFRQYTTSPDGQYVLATSAAATYLYIRSANLTITFPQVTGYNLSCHSCLSITADGSRFALLARAAGEWQVQVFDVNGDQLLPVQAISLDVDFASRENPATLALSPDGRYLAYSARSQPVQALNLDSGEQVFSYRNPADQLAFTPDGSRLMVFAGREMLFWDTTTWKNPVNLLAARSNQAWAFSPDGASIALALPNRLQVYDIASLKIIRQIILPADNAREWEIGFNGPHAVRGYAPTDTGYTMVEWNIETGETLRYEEIASPAPGTMEVFWAFSLPGVAPSGVINIPEIRLLRFVSPDTLLVNGGNYACWLRLATGENQCFTDPENTLVTSDGLTFRERLGTNATILEGLQSGQQVLETGTYRIFGVSRMADFVIVDLNNEGTYLYQQNGESPLVSFGGPLRDVAENAQFMIFHTVVRGTSSLTLFDKRNFREAPNLVEYQKTGSSIQKPVAISADGGEVYFLELNRDTGQSALNVVDLEGRISLLARLELPAEPEEMVVSTTGLFVIGLQDGSLFFYDSVSGNTLVQQFAQEPISRMSFSPDGRFLAVASTLRLSVLGILR